MRKIIYSFFLFLVLFMACTNVKADFTITPNIMANSVCPTNTILIENTVTALTAGAFTVATSGTASGFATTVPSGFWLQQGQSKTVYSYITPSSKIAPGTYDLIITIAQDSATKTVRHTIIVENCHKTILNVEPSSLAICACEEKNFELKIENKGKYLENYQLNVEGPASSFINFSSKSLSLAANSSATVEAYIFAPCNLAGFYEANFVVKGSTAYSQANAKANLEVVSCYDYAISSEKTFYSLCEAGNLSIPVKIKNSGTKDNRYKINIYGPSWANIDQKELSIIKDQEKTLNLIIKPPYKTEGNFTIAIETLSEYGKVMKKHELSFDVTKCYDVTITITEEQDKICNALNKSYATLVKNTGKFANTYNIELEGPSWATIEKHLALNATEEKTLSLDINPPKDTKAASYEIKVKIIDPISKAEASDAIKVETVTIEDCYKPAITAEKDALKVSRDSAAALTFTVENKGIRAADYIIEMSGTAISFSQINPAAITLESAKTETLYLYIAPPIETELGNYTITATARLKDTTIIASKSITISVAEIGEVPGIEIESITNVTNVTEIPEEKPRESWISKVISWLANLFKPKLKNVTEIANITSITGEQTTEETNKVPVLKKNIPDITIKQGQTYTFDLRTYFEDPDNDTLTYVTVKPLNIDVMIAVSTVTLKPEQDFKGERQITFYVSDGEAVAQSNAVKIIVEA